jgi:hypothetical protein
MRLNLGKYVSTLRVDPADMFDLDALLGACPEDERHRRLKLWADTVRDNLYSPQESVQLLRGWLNRAEIGDEITDTVRRSWSEFHNGTIDGGRQGKKSPLNTQRVISLWHQYGGYEDLLEHCGLIYDESVKDTLRRTGSANFTTTTT